MGQTSNSEETATQSKSGDGRDKVLLIHLRRSDFCNRGRRNSGKLHRERSRLLMTSNVEQQVGARMILLPRVVPMSLYVPNEVSEPLSLAVLVILLTSSLGPRVHVLPSSPSASSASKTRRIPSHDSASSKHLSWDGTSSIACSTRSARPVPSVFRGPFIFRIPGHDWILGRMPTLEPNFRS